MDTRIAIALGLVIFVILTTLVSFFMMSPVPKPADYLVAGGGLPFWALAGTITGTCIGTGVIIEGSALAYLHGWDGCTYPIGFGLDRCYLSDWLEHDAETITLWHVGAAPVSLCEPVGQPGGPRIARHFNIKKPAVIEATLCAGMSITIFRFWRLAGKYFLTAREGDTVKPKRHLMATNGLANMKDDPRIWFEDMCHAGMPHHVGVIQGHHALLLKRMARLLKIEFV